MIHSVHYMGVRYIEVILYGFDCNSTVSWKCVGLKICSLYSMSSMYRFDCYHETFLKKSFDDLFRWCEIFVSEDGKRLTSVYLLPKLHKNQTKTKLMIPALTCSVKPLSKYITSAFQFILNQVNSYNKQCLYFSGINSF